MYMYTLVNTYVPYKKCDKSGMSPEHVKEYVTNGILILLYEANYSLLFEHVL